MTERRQWITTPPTDFQVEVTKEDALVTLKSLNDSINRLQVAGHLPRGTADEIKSDIRNAIRKAEIAIVTERERDFYEQLAENPVTPKQRPRKVDPDNQAHYWLALTNLFEGFIDEDSHLEVRVYSPAFDQGIEVVIPERLKEDFMKRLPLFEADISKGRNTQGGDF